MWNDARAFCDHLYHRPDLSLVLIHVMKAFLFQVHDLIETPGHIQPRLYVVQGIHHGAENQEGILELIAFDRRTPDAHGHHQAMFVPIEMIEAGISSGLFSVTRA